MGVIERVRLRESERVKPRKHLGEEQYRQRDSSSNDRQVEACSRDSKVVIMDGAGGWQGDTGGEKVRSVIGDRSRRTHGPS